MKFSSPMNQIQGNQFEAEAAPGRLVLHMQCQGRHLTQGMMITKVNIKAPTCHLFHLSIQPCISLSQSKPPQLNNLLIFNTTSGIGVQWVSIISQNNGMVTIHQ